MINKSLNEKWKMINPKKSLGQNFLRDEEVLEKIIKSANLQTDDFVIEVGPGEGILTEKLSTKVSKVSSIEIDQNLISNLEKKFKDNEKVEIINDDILKINLENLTSNKNYKVVANIPYYITSKIIRLFLESKNPPSEIILMVQKEVAQRIVASPGKMSLLAVSVQYYANAELLFEVSRDSFFPVPEVDSAIIKIDTLKKNGDDSKKFFQVVKAGFSAKRKTLINNISNGLQLEKNLVAEKLKSIDLSQTVRAQELSIDDWKRLCASLNL